MNPSRSLLSAIAPRVAISLLGLTLLGCSHRTADPALAADPPTFAKARVVLETHCVHCHGDYRLKGMPPIDTTRLLSKLIGPGNYIIPGQPEQSRFFQVVTFPDEIPNAMPPTGHGISPAEVQALREWIVAGAPLPSGPSQKLHPQGEPPRSR
jgi:mono/diheme cytochrome c family protein